MQRTAAWFAVALCAAVLFTAIAGAAQSEHVVFLSTQLRPISARSTTSPSERDSTPSESRKRGGPVGGG